MSKEFILTNNLVLINFSEQFCKNEAEVLNSTGFARVWSKYIDHLFKIQNVEYLQVINLVNKPKITYIKLFKLLLSFKLDDIRLMDITYKLVLDYTDILFGLVNDFYDYWRRYQKYGVIYTRSGLSSFEWGSSIDASNAFNDLILKTYRAISQNINGKKYNIFRQLPAGVNVSLLITKFSWMNKESNYMILKDVKMIEQVVIRPPFIAYSAKNKRTGIYKESFTNPLDNININPDEYFLLSIYVGDSLAYVYFHRNFLGHAIGLCNLFEFVPKDECEGMKPSLLYLFGSKETKESIFYYDNKEDIYVGAAPLSDDVDYFGYLKKMLLTLHNVKMINSNYLPVHGACVNITLRNELNKTIVIIGDSGAGKSESLEALSKVGADYISNMTTIFDDMGTLKIENGEVVAYGTEIGAFVRLDDMTTGYAYKEMDRAIFMNPDKTNSRLIVPVCTYDLIMKGHKVDMVIYANNYSKDKQGVSFFTNKKEAIDVFSKGYRMSKGTTNEEGLVESYFANPFGPVQKQKETEILLEAYFNSLYENRVQVGELYTKLAIPGYEQKGPEEAAVKLLEVLTKG